MIRQCLIGSVLVFVIILGGCANNTETGALVGGAGGAAVGGAIGSFSHSRAGEGALIGGAVGAIGGALVGNEMDKQDQRDREQAAERATRRERERRYDADIVTKGDVIAWTKNGVSDDVIIDRIHRSGTVYRLNVDDENELRDAGVSEDVVRAMKATAK